MANSSQSTHQIQLGFLSTAFPDDPTGIHLVGVQGREEISRLFQYELLLKRPAGPLTDKQLEDLVRSPCAIALGPKPGDIVHGLLTEIEHLDATRHVQPVYLARMVPQFHLLTMTERSAIYQNKTIPKLVEKVLGAYGLKAGTHFEILVSTDPKKCPTREYIVQYQESDWAFLERWLEHEGYFYWFRHDKKRATLVIADANDDATLIEKPTAVSYRERNNLMADEATVFDFRVRQRRVPAKVTVVDYNYERPADKLVAQHDVDQGGYGNVFRYGEHFHDLDQGAEIARVRAERHQATRRTVEGCSDCTRFRVGHIFELENHYVPTYDANYLLTWLELRVGQDLAVAQALSTETLPDQLHAFSCRFGALHKDVPYRPERRTPWPRIHGFITGHVEEDSAGEYAQIDDQGRYKVKLAFDVSTTQGSQASRWIRLAQAYAGSGYGTHYPLHKGTEVLIAHADGDPDRPIIVGAVPNPHTISPVTAANATQSVLQTASGIRVELEDLQG